MADILAPTSVAAHVSLGLNPTALAQLKRLQYVMDAKAPFGSNVPLTNLAGGSDAVKAELSCGDIELNDGVFDTVLQVTTAGDAGNDVAFVLDPTGDPTAKASLDCGANEYLEDLDTVIQAIETGTAGNDIEVTFEQLETVDTIPLTNLSGGAEAINAILACGDIEGYTGVFDTNLNAFHAAAAGNADTFELAVDGDPAVKSSLDCSTISEIAGFDTVIQAAVGGVDGDDIEITFEQTETADTIPLTHLSGGAEAVNATLDCGAIEGYAGEFDTVLNAFHEGHAGNADTFALAADGPAAVKASLSCAGVTELTNFNTVLQAATPGDAGNDIDVVFSQVAAGALDPADVTVVDGVDQVTITWETGTLLSAIEAAITGSMLIEVKTAGTAGNTPSVDGGEGDTQTETLTGGTDAEITVTMVDGVVSVTVPPDVFTVAEIEAELQAGSGGHAVNTPSATHGASLVGVADAITVESFTDGADAVKSSLDLVTVCTSGLIDTVVEAHVAGIAGDALSIELIGDSAVGAGVTTEVAAGDLLIHFEDGVSTVGQIEAAITALAMGNDIIDVKTASPTHGAEVLVSATAALTEDVGAATVNISWEIGASLAEIEVAIATSELIEVKTPGTGANNPLLDGGSGDTQVENLAGGVDAEIDVVMGAGAIVVTVPPDVFTVSEIEAELQIASGGNAVNFPSPTHGASIVSAADAIAEEHFYEGADAVKSSLDLATVCPSELIDTVVEAKVAGISGDALSIEFIGDSAVGAGVTTEVTEGNLLIHFEDGVSTVAQIEAAITALALEDDIIDVKTASPTHGAQVLVSAVASLTEDLEELTVNLSWEIGASLAEIEVAIATSELIEVKTPGTATNNPVVAEEAGGSYSTHLEDGTDNEIDISITAGPTTIVVTVTVPPDIFTVGEIEDSLEALTGGGDIIGVLTPSAEEGETLVGAADAIPETSFSGGADAVKASLDLATVCPSELVDTVVEATDAGAAGNAKAIRLVNDSEEDEGVVIEVVGVYTVVHYEEGVSTVDDIESAITALSGAENLIGVKTSGTGANILNGEWYEGDFDPDVPADLEEFSDELLTVIAPAVQRYGDAIGDYSLEMALSKLPAVCNGIVSSSLDRIDGVWTTLEFFTWCSANRQHILDLSF